MKILTYNIQTLMGDECERINDIATEIKRTSAHFICLQEVTTPHMRNVINDKLGKDYYVINTHKYNVTPFPLFSYVPSFIYSLMTLYTYTHFRYLYLFCSILFFPYFTLFFLQPFDKLFKFGYIKKIDCKGLCILVSKMACTPPVVIENNIFKHHGYGLDISLFRWFQITFFRPGYLLVSTTEKCSDNKFIICNTHLALEGSEQGRLTQGDELLAKINDLYDQNPDTLILLAGDMNSHNDAVIQLMNNNLQTLVPTPIITWDCNNPRTQSYMWSYRDNVLSRQVDYIWCKSNKKINVLTACRIGTDLSINLSDHYGLYSRFII